MRREDAHREPVHGVELHPGHAGLDLGVDDGGLEQTLELVDAGDFVHPDAGEIRLALGCARHRRRQP
jgi:hypothetical protein